MNAERGGLFSTRVHILVVLVEVVQSQFLDLRVHGRTQDAGHIGRIRAHKLAHGSLASKSLIARDGADGRIHLGCGPCDGPADASHGLTNPEIGPLPGGLAGRSANSSGPAKEARRRRLGCRGRNKAQAHHESAGGLKYV